MVRHVVCFRWKEGTTPEQVDEVAAAPREFPGLIPEIRSFKCRPDLGVHARNWDLAVVPISTRPTTRPSIATIRCTSA
jgi:hypothetical protein